MNKKILVVDDEDKITDVVASYLEKEGYDVITSSDGKEALEIFNREEIHLIILDLMLPNISGEEICTKIRNVSDVPIIMLTAKVEEDNKIEGLAIGADDYVTKPFSVRELVGRVKALIRRSYKEENPVADYLTFNDGDLEVFIDKFEVKKKGKKVSLTASEFKVLKILLTNPRQVFTRDMLIEKALGMDYDGYNRTIDTHIKNIRQKIEDDPKKPKYVLTVYGVGYKFGGN
ncbi:two component transcriptional regulator [Gottschalkia purinilytica]|uniref:Two component transcriptional regulator n=1 Tax=Gottschalkia purinilytica TaxID=1503 RepID=A0A0L0W6B9_GOTPU|nr:response regulator transcription factor [Gottschalkia purinilytica]KNF07026.1 two component transcriptional regulator [Gottschalkia purinilytica]